jgi:hypothetical protein
MRPTSGCSKASDSCGVALFGAIWEESFFELMRSRTWSRSVLGLEAPSRGLDICLYDTNGPICDEMFLAGRRKLSVIDYMLQNKTDAAFDLLDQKAAELIAPPYIKEALEWIRR